MSRPLRPSALLLSVTVLVALAACTPEAPAPSGTPTPSPSAASSPSGSPSSTPSSKPTSKPSPKPKPATYDWLTGAKRRSSHPVWAVKIENTSFARPQVGLYQADITVVEEVEASITRMIGIFHTRFPTRVGPVRSARNTDAELLPLFGRPGLLYSGANGKVQRNIRAASLVPVERSDRDSSRVAPHNVMVDLRRLTERREVGKARSIGWTFAATDRRWINAPKVADPAVKVGMDTTSFRWSAGRYSVYWNGERNVDGDRGVPVRTDNVVVLSVKNHHDNDSTSSISIVSETVGSGKVVIYRDHKRLVGTWKRSRVGGPMRFLGSQGRDLPLKPGQTWMLLQGR